MTRQYYLRKLVSVAFSVGVVSAVWWLCSPTPGVPDLRDARVWACDLNPTGKRTATADHYHTVDTPGWVRCFVGGRERTRIKVDVTQDQEND